MVGAGIGGALLGAVFVTLLTALNPRFVANLLQVPYVEAGRPNLTANLPNATDSASLLKLAIGSGLWTGMHYGLAFGALTLILGEIAAFRKRPAA